MHFRDHIRPSGHFREVGPYPLGHSLSQPHCLLYRADYRLPVPQSMAAVFPHHSPSLWDSTGEGLRVQEPGLFLDKLKWIPSFSIVFFLLLHCPLIPARHYQVAVITDLLSSHAQGPTSVQWQTFTAWFFRSVLVNWPNLKHNSHVMLNLT